MSIQLTFFYKNASQTNTFPKKKKKSVPLVPWLKALERSRYIVHSCMHLNKVVLYHYISIDSTLAKELYLQRRRQQLL
jgi:hypothetical protein